MQPLQIAVFPQRRDRVGHRLAGAHCGDDAYGPVERQLMQQGGRQLIQQVGIVDTDDRTIPGEEGFPSGGHTGDRVW